MKGPAEFTVVVSDAGRNARDLLIEASKLSSSQVSTAMTSGAVWLKTKHGIRRIRRKSATLSVGDEIYLNYDEAVLTQTTAPAELIRDGGRWSVWKKPFGMRSQGSKWGDHTTLGRYAETNLEPLRESFIVHRLDLAAQGLMMLAHDKKAAANIAGQFAARTVGKRYHAIVHGKFSGQADARQYTGEIDGKAAETKAVRLRFDPETSRSVLLVSISTGRKHQIRRHLSEAGFPIVGDRMYGKDKSVSDFNLQRDRDYSRPKLKSDTDFSSDTDLSLRLFASRLTFNDPDTGERIKCECIPQEWL